MSTLFLADQHLKLVGIGNSFYKITMFISLYVFVFFNFKQVNTILIGSADETKQSTDKYKNKEKQKQIKKATTVTKTVE